MFSRTAALYDTIYGSFKDYAEESGLIHALLKRVHPHATALLDVACGTGEHARRLAEDYDYSVDGIDIEPEFVRIAQSKNPDGRFEVADMRSFSLGRQYDVVMCLFSSIAYAKTVDGVIAVLKSCKRHLAPGGVLVVEPWFEPEQWIPGRVYLHTGETEAVKVCRMSHSEQAEGLSVLRFHYLVGRSEGIEHIEETHELALLTRVEMHTCFAAAGFDQVEYDEAGLIGRGLYVAQTQRLGRAAADN